jgi:hypothetical protein
VLLQGSTRILIYIDGLLSVAQTVPKPFAILPSSIFQRSIALDKRLAGSPGLKLIGLLTLTKSVTPGSTRILIYMDGLLSIKLCPDRCYLAFLPLNVQLLVAGWFYQRAEIDPS